MPWDERTVNNMRQEFVERVLAQEKSKSALCREYGISRPTGDKWIARYLAGEPLEDRSSRPHTTSCRTPPQTEALILQLRQEHPALGAAKIHRILQDRGHSELPCVRTVNNILKRSGMITREASLAATPYKRFEKNYPNEMWQADFKGHFPMQDGQRCHPLNIVDDHSRFNLCCRALPAETLEAVKPVMAELFQEYGLPETFLCDNGNPWGTVQSTGYTKFEVWLMELDVLTIHGRFRHPQTQGKEERFNGTMTRELLKHTTIANMADAQAQFDAYRQFYNCERPHHALGLDTPAKHYEKSRREYPCEITKWEYPEGCEVRKVKETGFFSWGSQGYFLSEGFGGKEIAVRPSQTEGCISLFFRDFRIGRIDIDKRVFTYKKAYRIENDPRLNDNAPGSAPHRR